MTHNRSPKRTSRSFARSQTQIIRAREFRQAATPAEEIAWQLLRKLRVEGFTFRRQHPLGKCVVDFCCPQRRLVVELDGSVHAQPSQVARDASRDRYLARLGYTVLRFPNGLALNAPEEFTKRVLDYVSLDPLTPGPSPPRGRGES
jgi:very-short-patch-repair endonuclease